MQYDTIDRGLILRSMLNTLNHMLIAIISYHMLWFSLYTKYSNPFSWHVALCTIGYVVLMAESILVFSYDNSWTRTLPRQTAKTVHWILQATGSTLCIAGIAIEINNKVQSNKLHFKSAHAITGLISMILVILACFGGVPALFAMKFRFTIRPVILKLFHNILGTLAFVIGMISYILGYYTNWFKRNTSNELVIFLVICTTLVIVLSLINSLRSAYSQIRSLKLCEF